MQIYLSYQKIVLIINFKQITGFDIVFLCIVNGIQTVIVIVSTIMVIRIELKIFDQIVMSVKN